LGPVKILIFDSSERWRLSVRAILAADVDLKVFGEGQDGLEAVQRCSEVQPDLVILDLLLPKINGVEAARQITEISPGTKVVFLSDCLSRDMMRAVLRIGAGFVMKADAERDLLSVVTAAVHDKSVVRFRVLDDDPADSSEM
jgi:DNA-binding NarL/FixJ family response regulator